MNDCKTSVATVCNNTEFTSNYSTASDCISKINCDTTKIMIPSECMAIKAKKISDRAKNCTSKTIPGTFSYCMSYIKENISTVLSDCFDQAPTTAAVTTATTTTIMTLSTDEGTTTTNTAASYCPLILAERPILVRSTTEPPVSPIVTPAVAARKRRLYL